MLGVSDMQMSDCALRLLHVLPRQKGHAGEDNGFASGCGLACLRDTAKSASSHRAFCFCPVGSLPNVSPFSSFAQCMFRALRAPSLASSSRPPPHRLALVPLARIMTTASTSSQPNGAAPNGTAVNGAGKPNKQFGFDISDKIAGEVTKQECVVSLPRVLERDGLVWSICCSD